MDTKNKIFSALRWALLNFGSLFLAYRGFILEDARALSLLTFITLVAAIISNAMFIDSIRADLQKAGRSVPKFISNLSDVILIGTCAYFGCYWLAAGWMWKSIMESVGYDTKPKAEEPEAK